MRIPGFSRYDIDENARVVDTLTGEEVERHTSARYAWVMLYADGETKKRTQKQLHVLMATTFYGPRPEGCMARFVDNDRTNITKANIVWASRKEFCTKLTKERKPKRNNTCNPDSMSMLYDVLRALDGPETMANLAAMLAVSYSTVRYSMYGLIAAGKATAVEGGYIAI